MPDGQAARAQALPSKRNCSVHDAALLEGRCSEAEPVSPPLRPRAVPVHVPSHLLADSPHALAVIHRLVTHGLTAGSRRQRTWLAPTRRAVS